MVYKCGERNRARKNFCFHGTFVTMAINGYLLNSVNLPSIKMIFLKDFFHEKYIFCDAKVI